jgi:hypothetical protein
MSRVAIVTGSGPGIEKATAVQLTQAGCDVGVAFHSDEEGAAEPVEAVTAYCAAEGIGQR